MALIHRPTACVQAGIHERSECDHFRGSEGIQRKRPNAFSTASTYVADRGPGAGGPDRVRGSGGRRSQARSNKLWSSKASASKQRSGRQQRFEKLDKEMKSRSGRLLGTSKVILTIKPGQEANAEKEIKKLGGRLGRRLKLVNGMAVELPEPGHQADLRALGSSERPLRPSDCGAQ